MLHLPHLFLCLLTLNLLSTPSFAQREICGQLDICFVVDSSGSIRDNQDPNKPDNWLTILNFVNQIIDDNQITIGPRQTQVGVVKYSNHANLEFGLTKYNNKIELTNAVLAIPYGGGFTNTMEALLETRTDCFGAQDGDRDYAPNLVIIITDGDPTAFTNSDGSINDNDRAASRRLAIEQADLLKSAGAGIIAIGVTDLIDENFLRIISSPPHVKDQNYFLTTDYNLLSVFLAPILQSACDIMTPIPLPTFEHANCNARVDIALVLDMSRSIVFEDQDNWARVLNFATNLVKAFPIGLDLTRVGMVTFSDAGHVEFYLDQYTTEASLENAIQSVAQRGMETNIVDGLRVMRTQLFGNRGDRPDIKNIAFFVTDGRANVNAGGIQGEADAAHALDIDIFAIGVTEHASIEQLEIIASQPHDDHGDHVFLIDDFVRLQEYVHIIIEDACKVATTIATTTPMPTLPPSTGCNGDPVDVVFILDSSGSISEVNFGKVKDFLIELIRGLAVDTGKVRVAVVVFSTAVREIFYLDTYSSRLAMIDAVSEIQYMRGTTNTASALSFVRNNVFQSGRGDRSNAQNLAILLTDGASSDAEQTMREAVMLKTHGVHVISVGIGNWLNVYELKAIASYPVSQNVLFVENFDSINSIQNTIKDIVCDNANPCRSNPCRRGQCQNYITYYLCQCPTGSAGPGCESLCIHSADVVFALDTSGSVGPENFRLMVDFLTSVVEKLAVDNAGSATQGVRVGLVSFSTQTYLQFHLNAYTNKEDLLNAIALRYRGGSTNTADVIRFVQNEMFRSDRGDRANVQNVLVLVTDGRSNNQDQTWHDAMAARQAGINIVTIGIGSGVDVMELQGIASDPTSKNVFTLPSFNQLDSVVNTIASTICNNQDECRSNPCHNGAVCKDVLNGYYCGPCPPGYTGPNCERRGNGVEDVVFLIDASGSIRHERFPQVLDFVTRVIEQLDVGQSATRVGLLYWSNSATVGFYLDEYDTKQDVIQAVLHTPFRGERTYTAQGLQMMRQDIFNRNRGDRANVPNFCIIITDGNSNINVEQTLPEAIQARIDGVHIVVVSVGNLVNMIELEGMASLPVSSNIFQVEGIASLPNVIMDVVNDIGDMQNECQSNPCQNGGVCVDDIHRYTCNCRPDYTGYDCRRRCSRQYDVSFILDLSGSMDEEYRLTIELAKYIVYGLDMNLDRVRIAVMAYSDNVFSNFYLNAYQGQKDGVINALNFYHHGGRTNTQAALSRSLNDVFSTGNGDRSGVDNIAIIISDGNSNVNEGNTIPEANRMRNDGIRVFSLATGDTPDMAEMNGIANDPDSEYVYKVRNLGEVQSVAGRLLDYLCR